MWIILSAKLQLFYPYDSEIYKRNLIQSIFIIYMFIAYVYIFIYCKE